MALARATHYHAVTADSGTPAAQARSSDESPSTIY